MNSYEITSTTILKHVFKEAKNEEAYAPIIIKLNA